jgi:formylglycine-generating enzyme required for sulfatase activity
MVLVPGGTYLMGTDGTEIAAKYGHFGPGIRGMLKCEIPRHEETVAAFFMDRCEVTNQQFYEFVRAHPQWQRERILSEYHNGDYLKHWDGGRFPQGTADHPVVYVSWFAAMAYAAWAGKRLPLESEWEYAARGGLRDAEYPWGDDPPSPARANFAESNLRGVVSVGHYPPNGFGLFDMAGNVWEYCLDPWHCSYDCAMGPSGEVLPKLLITKWPRVRTRRVIRGGSWGGAPVNLRVAFRDSHPPEDAGPHVGFRCVMPATHLTGKHSGRTSVFAPDN